MDEESRLQLQKLAEESHFKSTLGFDGNFVVCDGCQKQHKLNRYEIMALSSAESEYKSKETDAWLRKYCLEHKEKIEEMLRQQDEEGEPDFLWD